MLQLLESGKDVVTANKALLGRARPGAVRPGPRTGPVDRVRSLGGRRHPDHREHQPVPVGEPDSVARRHSQRHDEFHPQQDARGRRWPTPMRSRKRSGLGYAEADPTLDVDGSDAAQKLAILAHLAFGARVRLERYPANGNRPAGQERCAIRTGNRLSNQATGRRGAGRRHAGAARVADAGEARPAPLRRERTVQCDSRRGRCGRRSDVLRPRARAKCPRRRLSSRTSSTLRLAARRLRFARWSCGRTAKRCVTPREHAKADGRFYLRVNAEDHPGVLAQVASVLGEHHISISSVLQQEAAK